MTETSTIKAVKFYSLLSDLSHAERIEFIHQFAKENAKVIEKALFTYIWTWGEEVDVANRIIASVSKMIVSRKKKPESPQMTVSSKKEPEQSEATHIKLDALPKAIIGHTASYLQHADFVNLSEVSNRNVYLGCNDPCTLQEYCMILDGGSDIDLLNMPHLKKLTVKLSGSGLFTLPFGGPLEELVLDAKGLEYWDGESVSFAVNSEKHAVRKVKLINFHGYKRSKTLLEILNVLKGVEMLSLNFCYGGAEALTMPHKIISKCKNLKGMSFYQCDSTFITPFINAFGSTLKYLVLDNQEAHPRNDFGDINFGGLRRLRIIKNTCSRTMNILKTAINLRKVFIDLRCSHAGTAVSQIMKCKNLEYLHIVATCRVISDVFQGIRRGLTNMIKMNKTKIKIRVKVVGDTLNARFGSMLKLEFDKTVRSMQGLKDFQLIISLNDAHATWQMLKGHIEC